MNKVYDGTDTAPVTLGTVTGVDSAYPNVSVSVSATYSNKNVGTGKKITVKYTLSGSDSYRYGINDSIMYGNITAKPLTANSTASNKTYDGNTNATVTLGTVSGKINDDDVIVSASGTFADKNVGTGKTVTIQYTILGTDMTNYSMADKTVTANITKKPITAITGITVNNKTYNGNTTATLNKKTSAAGVTFTGMVSGDSLEISSATTLAFADKNVETGKAVTVSGITLGGASAGNYSIASTVNAYASGTTKATANITAKELTATSTASNKTYDGTTTATATLEEVTGIIDGDTVTVTPTGTFEDENVGTGKTVTVTCTLSGEDADNYTIILDTPTVTADITAKEVTLEWSDTPIYYNGDIQTPDVYIDGVIDGDECEIAEITGGGINAGSHTATASGLTNSNYVISSGASEEYTILPKTITAITGITVKDKLYDGTVTAELDNKSSSDGVVFDGMIDGDELEILSATVSFDNADPDDYKTVTVSGITLGGESAGNYEIEPSLQAYWDETTKAEASIIKINLNETSFMLDVSDCIYDGTEKKPTVTVKYDGSVLIEGVHYTVEYSDNVEIGTAKVTVSGLGNYSEGTISATFDIKTAAPSQGNPEDPAEESTAGLAAALGILLTVLVFAGIAAVVIVLFRKGKIK